MKNRIITMNTIHFQQFSIKHNSFQFMDILLKNLKTKSEVDDVIRNTEDKV